MEKKLLRKINVYLVEVTIMLLLFIICILGGWAKKSAYKSMGQILFRAEKFYKESQIAQEEKLSIYATDYITRIKTVNYMFEKHQITTTTEGMQEIKKLLNLEEIYVLDANGKIVLSSDENSLGTGLLDNEDAIPFAELIQGNASDVILSLDAEEILECHPNLGYIADVSSNPAYRMILLGIDKHFNEFVTKDTLPETILEGIPTTKNESLFAVDCKTGKIIGESSDNAPWLELSELGNDEDILRLLKASEEGCMVWLANKPILLRNRNMNTIALVDLYYPVIRLEALFWIVSIIVVLIIIIMYIMFITIQRYFRKYVFNEITDIQQDINQIIQGNKNIEFQTSNNTEMTIITNTLNKWNRSIQNAQDRLNWAIKIANPDTAIFECFSYMNRVYFSDNIQVILGVDDKKWTAIKNNAFEFLDYIKALSEKMDANGITEVNNKFLEIEIKESGEEYFGIITDKTKEILAEQQQQNALKMALDEAETDALTKLLNRRGFENRVCQEMSETEEKSMKLLMIDVDNFKQVNDTLGHPVGDKVLQQISRLIKDEFCKRDIIARMGGDEFAVLLIPDIPLPILEKKLQTLLKNVEEELSEYNSGVSISIGVACMKKVSSYEELYQRADEVLYAAKKAGKNRYLIKAY